MSDLTDAIRTIRESREQYQKAQDYYDGRIREVFASPTIRRRLERTGMAYRINMARRPVDAVLDRLELASVAVVGDEAAQARAAAEADPESEPTPDAVADWWAEQWDANEMDLEAPEIHRTVSIFGDAYLVAWPDDDDEEDEPDEGGEVEPSGDLDVCMDLNSPLTMRLFYDPERPRRKAYAAKMWQEGSGSTATLRVTLYYPDRIERYQAKNDKATEDGDFAPYTDDDAAEWPIPNPYGQVPVFHFRNGRPYGTPEHLDAYGPQDALTKLVVSQMTTTDFQAFPQRWALLGEATDDLSDFDDEDETDDPANNVSGLKAGPGELWSLRNVQSVGQFPAADPRAFLDPMAAYVHFMATVTATPLHYFEPMGDVPSGESFRAAEAPLVKKVEARERSYGPTWRDVAGFALRIAGLSGKVDVRWSPIQSADDLSGWQAVEAKRGAGVPLRQCLIEAGYDAELVDGWLAANEDDDLKGRIEALATLGAAVSGLSSGAAVGIVDHAQVTAIIDRFLALDAAEKEPAA